MAIKVVDLRKAMRDLDDRTAKFYAALEGEDDLGVVLRAHIYIEHELKLYVSEVAPKPDQIKFSSYDYNSLIALALMLGLPSDLKAALTSIGNLCNKFAHTLEMELTTQEANALYNTLSPNMNVNMQQGHASCLKNPKYGDANLPKSVARLNPKMLFGVCATFIRGAIMLQTLEAYVRTLGLKDELQRVKAKMRTESPN